MQQYQVFGWKLFESATMIKLHRQTCPPDLKPLSYNRRRPCRGRRTTQGETVVKIIQLEHNPIWGWYRCNTLVNTEICQGKSCWLAFQLKYPQNLINSVVAPTRFARINFSFTPFSPHFGSALSINQATVKFSLPKPITRPLEIDLNAKTSSSTCFRMRWKV